MAKSSHRRSYARYTGQVLSLLGKMIRAGRIERNLTAADLAQRVGISRSTLHRIENGDPRVEIGIVFEAAAIVGIKLFDSEEKDITILAGREDNRLAVLPRYVRKPAIDIDDAF